MNIPKQYLPVMPYLILDNPQGFLEFAKKVLSAKEQLIVQTENGESIQHGELTIGSAVIMFAGATKDWKQQTAAMYLHVGDVNSIYSKAIANGGSMLYTPGHKDYGYTAGFEDPFGNQWYIVGA